MRRLILTKQVSVAGRDFIGRPALVLLTPTEIGKPGWFWDIEGEQVPISVDTLGTKKNRITLSHGRARLNVFEHLGALRFAGLDGVVLNTKQRWLPYDGSAKIFWDACQKYLRQESLLSPIQYPPTTIDEGSRSVSYTPTPHDDLVIEVVIDYPGLGSYRKPFRLSKLRFVQLARVKTQGWPMWRKPFAEVAAQFGWPHAENVVWPQDHDTWLTLELFARHRALDILGAFNVLCTPNTILAGTIISKCAGHALDVKLIKKMAG